MNSFSAFSGGRAKLERRLTAMPASRFSLIAISALFAMTVMPLTIGAPSICADCAFHAWFVLGPEVPDWRSLDLSKQPVRAWKQDTIVAEGSGANALGDPRIALTWLANHLNKRGLGLKAGVVITTGTCVKPVDVVAGDTVVMDYFALGKMSAGFD